MSLAALIQSGQLSELRWPNFTDYRVYLTDFYQPSAYTLAWVKDKRPTPQAAAAIEAFENAGSKGLNAEDYDGPRWAGRVANLQKSDPGQSGEVTIRFDLAVTVSLMRLVSDLHMGRVNPRYFHSGFNIGPAKYDLAQLLRQWVADARDIGAALEMVEPPFPSYRRAQEALVTYIHMAQEDNGEQLPAPQRSVKSGDSYPGVPRLARLLRLLGDLPSDADVPLSSELYDGRLAEAVKRFQRRHGLEPDGRLGTATLEQLNAPLSKRVQQLQLALERWRWVPHEFSRPPIIVNLPEFQLRAWDRDDNVALTLKVVVGEAYKNETPVFAKEMKYLVFRPYWNVPVSIQKNELVPKLKRDPEYLAKNGYEITDSDGKVVTTGAAENDTLSRLRWGGLSIRQIPGPHNSLGLIKFMFPNEYDVYLHGTPAQGLFSRSRRDFSHGCIRVEDPAKLAAWVLQDNPGWNDERIQAAMHGSETVQVSINHPILVVVFYATAEVLETCEVRFFPDIYGHDATLQRALTSGYPHPGE